MRFDWKKFCMRHHVPYVTSGPNVARGHLGIKCPWCGSGDPSEHMGLCLDVHNPAWGCFRNSAHRGRSPARLVSKLLNIRLGVARALIEEDKPPLDDFDASVERLRKGDEDVEEKQEPHIEHDSFWAPFESFRRITEGAYGKRFVEYLAYERGFGADAERVARDYDLRYALSGTAAWRLIFPVRSPAGAVCGWTGREIRSGARQRYLTTPGLPDGALIWPARENGPKAFLRRSGEMLAAVEGPLDCLKLDFYGREYGVRAVAPMGAASSEARSATMRRLGVRFVIFDEDATAQALIITEQIPGAIAVFLPEGSKDPGAFSPDEARKFCARLASSA